jgi:outer membrane protein insertion porin family
MLNKIFKLFSLFAIVLLSACSNIKYLPQGESLYIGGEVKVQGDSVAKSEKKKLNEELEGLLRPKPNTSVLGLRYKLYAYNIAGEVKKPRGFKNWLKNKFGEPPVLLSQVNIPYNEDILVNRLQNRGYFRAAISSDTLVKNRRAKVNYKPDTGPQYTIKSVVFDVDSTSDLGNAIAGTADQSFLKVGEAYDLDVIKAERERIDNRIKEQGFYYFSPDHLLIQADSTIGTHDVDLFVIVKNDIPDKASRVYHINEIFIYPNYSLNQRGIERDTGLLYRGYRIVDRNNTFRPHLFRRAMFFQPGEVYNRTDQNKSLNRLVNLGVFKFVKNNFKEADSAKALLNTYYYLTPFPRKSLRLEALGKTASTYNGAELNLSWRNRSAFRAGELLSISAYGGYETQISGQNKGFNLMRVGAQVSLTWPRFIIPFNFNSTGNFVPRTKASFGYELINRQKLYTLNSSTISWSYIWKESIKKEHQLTLLDFNYVQPSKVTDLYMRQIDSTMDPTLQRVIDRQFIIGTSYNFNYTNTNETSRKNTFYYNASLGLSGNILGLINGADINEGKTYSLLGANFSQYIKMEHDFRHYLKLGENSQLATRLIAGIGYAYGNSRNLPYVKQFFIGGANSIRAFAARTLGPGSYLSPTTVAGFIADQSGDIKLEANTEWRPKLFSIVRGALFVDAGNIWLLNDDPEQPRQGAVFSKDFLKEVAVGVGFGLRFDLSFLVLRTDLAFPVRKPWLAEGQRWVMRDIDFGNSRWRKDNLVFNLAIGYPF